MSLVLLSLVLLSLALPSLWITPVKISISGLMYVTGVTVTGITFLMDNTSEDHVKEFFFMDSNQTVRHRFRCMYYMFSSRS